MKQYSRVTDITKPSNMMFPNILLRPESVQAQMLCFVTDIITKLRSHKETTLWPDLKSINEIFPMDFPIHGNYSWSLPPQSFS